MTKQNDTADNSVASPLLWRRDTNGDGDCQCSAASEGMTLQQVAAELRGMHEQFLCPTDTYFLRMAETVEKAIEWIASDDRDEMIDDLCAKVDRLERHTGCRVSDYIIVEEDGSSVPITKAGLAVVMDSRHRIEQQQAEIEQLRALLAGPKFFWDDNNLESAYESIHQAVEFLDVGDVVMLRPIIEQPMIWVRVGEDEHGVYDSEEAARAAGGKR